MKLTSKEDGTTKEQEAKNIEDFKARAAANEKANKEGMKRYLDSLKK